MNSQHRWTAIGLLLFVFGTAGWVVGHRSKEESAETDTASAVQARQIATALANAATSADEIVLLYGPGQRPPDVRFKDKQWITELSKALGDSDYTPIPHSLMISYPIIRLYRDGHEVLYLMYRGTTIFVGIDEVQGDFTVSEKFSAAVGKLIKAKEASQTPAPTTTAVGIRAPQDGTPLEIGLEHAKVESFEYI